MIKIKGKIIVWIFILIPWIITLNFFIRNIINNPEHHRYSSMDDFFMAIGSLVFIISIVGLIFIIIKSLILLSKKEFKINIKKLKL